jgi:NTP pyrophosphatase (non-canonical NTP hydrolase)
MAICELCGEPMPLGEEMFKFHGHSGPCPKPPIPRVIPNDLSLALLSRVNQARAKRWHNGDLDEWSVNDWLAAFGGEAGEALNAGKKHRRILSGLQQHGNVQTTEREAAQKIMEELADAVIYADLVATRLGLNLAQAIKAKFNAISDREGFPERL